MEKHGRLSAVILEICGSSKSLLVLAASTEAEFVEIHPCAGFKIEIFQEGDHVATHDINLGGLELGMFARALKYEDIERMEILYRNGTPDLVYFPYKRQRY